MNTKHIAIGVIALAVVGFAALQFRPSGPSSEEAMKMEATDVEETSQDYVTQEGHIAEDSDDEDDIDADLEDGIYEADGAYTSPAGDETIGVSVTLEDGKIIAATVEAHATHSVSSKLQNLFIEGYEEEVIGKNIADVELDVVNGSSLTPQGFNDALDQIIEEARTEA